ncbi:14324_t:CDS:2 [Acaulospora morrowiae]|uniref:14324_t:CDS:1 n=1 Tax=Acaulospora morrowiae TaxID=94023 RepID=A0A9N9G564_9GLOM|nr:14324_t:CDS:2 [Acaulospora morrowiae]
MHILFSLIKNYLIPTFFVESCSYICHFLVWVYFCGVVYPIPYLDPVFNEHIPPPKKPTTWIGTFVFILVVMMSSVFGTSIHGKKAIKAGGGGITKIKIIKHLEEKVAETQVYHKRRIAKVVKYYEQELENVKKFHDIMVEIMAEDIASLQLELNEIREERDLRINEINEIRTFQRQIIDQEALGGKGTESWKGVEPWKGTGSWEEFFDFISVN